MKCIVCKKKMKSTLDYLQHLKKESKESPRHLLIFLTIRGYANLPFRNESEPKDKINDSHKKSYIRTLLGV